jgi:hypothetical protein
MDVETHSFAANLQNAPQLKAVLPEFMDKYRKLFRNGSHWLITDEEFDALEQAILTAGEGHLAPKQPRLVTNRPQTRGRTP